MATTFYGPWYVVLSLPNRRFAKRFVISGSDNADGIYPVNSDNPLVLSVEGAKWQIEIQYISIFIPAGWESAFVNESMKFVLGDGLIVELNGSARIPVMDPPLFDPPIHLMRITCTSVDPDINPIPAANPYSFTLGEGSDSGYEYGHDQYYHP